ncbi:hypothetical protein CWS02_18085 [Enterobacter sp. EA-1]|nr:hypothetical protein CWS02_18085 [Enterobacter sp. EA-1]
MKTIKYAVAAIALSTLSFGAFAAQSVSPAQAENLNKIGVVSVNNADTLDGLEAKLAEKQKRLAHPATALRPLTAITNERHCGYLQITSPVLPPRRTNPPPGMLHPH